MKKKIHWLALAVLLIILITVLINQHKTIQKQTLQLRIATETLSIPLSRITSVDAILDIESISSEKLLPMGDKDFPSNYYLIYTSEVKSGLLWLTKLYPTVYNGDRELLHYRDDNSSNDSVLYYDYIYHVFQYFQTFFDENTNIKYYIENNLYMTDDQSLYIKLSDETLEGINLIKDILTDYLGILESVNDDFENSSIHRDDIWKEQMKRLIEYSQPSNKEFQDKINRILELTDS